MGLKLPNLSQKGLVCTIFHEPVCGFNQSYIDIILGHDEELIIDIIRSLRDLNQIKPKGACLLDQLGKPTFRSRYAHTPF